MAYHKLGDFNRAIEYHKQNLSIAKELGDRADEGRAYNNLGMAYHKLGDFNQAIEYHKRYLSIAKELGDRADEGRTYNNLGMAYHKLGDFNQAIEYHKRYLSIAKELGDRADEGRTYDNLGRVYQTLDDFNQAIEYFKQHLSIAKELGDRADEGRTYNNLGMAYHKLGDFNQAIEYHKQHLSIAKELGDRADEGIAYNNLGLFYLKLGDLNQVIEYFEQYLSIAKELGDRAGEVIAYNNLGMAYYKLGDFNQAIEYHKQYLSIAKELGDSAGEGRTYNNLGWVYHMLGDFNQAIEYYKQYLSIAKELGDRADEGCAYNNLGIVYHRLGDFNQAIEYHKQHLSIAKELGDRAGKGRAYNTLGFAYNKFGDVNKIMVFFDSQDSTDRLQALESLGFSYLTLKKVFRAVECFQEMIDLAKGNGDRKKEASAYSLLGRVYAQRADFELAKEYLEKALTIAKELRDRSVESQVFAGFIDLHLNQGDFGRAKEYHKKVLNFSKETMVEIDQAILLHNMGSILEFSGDLHEAVDYYQHSIKFFDELRVLQAKDEFKVTFDNAYHLVYDSLWITLLKLSKIDEALCIADQGRAQALLDLIKLRYGSQLAVSGSVEAAKSGISEMVTDISGSTLFVALQGNAVNLWVIGKDRNVQFTKKEVKYLLGDATDYLNCLRKKAYEEIRGRFRVICENRTLDGSSTEQELPPAEERGEETGNPLQSDENPLRLFHECIISPISDLIEDGELVVVPDGPLCLAPFAAFLDSESKYLSESMRLRFLPSLMCMKLINASPEEYHQKSGALLVGNPCLAAFTTLFGENKFSPLPFAEKEVKMIGEMLDIHPLTGKEATKAEVLKRIGSVAVVHIAAHGKIDTGEIALAPNPERKYRRPEEQDFRLTIPDVQAAKLRAKLVVLSCCHSAQGKVSSEGVVGIARAFLGAGARSVLVALWSIEDEATVEFMRSFYQNLKDGNSASVSLNRAMKCLRESENFNAPRFWAPFVLIGDDVTLDFGQISKES